MTLFNMHRRQAKFIHKMFSVSIAFMFITSAIVPPQLIYAQSAPQTILNLPTPGAMISLSPQFTPALIKGITVHPQNPLEFDFIVNRGATGFSDEELKKESRKLIKYFLAALTVPEQDLWVNLSPYEKDRIIPQEFGQTEMGRDLLAQDYILKQLTASLMYPEDGLGEKFWKRVHQKSKEMYGTTEIPLNTFNKIWIVPNGAVVYEQGNSAYVVESHLKVMLEEDLIALQKNAEHSFFGDNQLNDKEVVSGVQSQIIREILIPEI